MKIPAVLNVAATCTAPGFFVVSISFAAALIKTGFSLATLMGAALVAAVFVWCWRRIWRLLSIGLILEGVEGIQRILAERGIIVSHEKALEISAGIAEAQRVAREVKGA